MFNAEYAYGNYNVTSLDKITRKIIQSHVCTGHSSEDYIMVQGEKGAKLARHTQMHVNK